MEGMGEGVRPVQIKRRVERGVLILAVAALQAVEEESIEVVM